MPTRLLTKDDALKIIDVWLLQHRKSISLADPIVDYIHGPFDGKTSEGEPCKFFYVYMRSPIGVEFTVKNNKEVIMKVNSI